MEIDLEQKVLMIFLPVTAAAREAGAEGSVKVVPIFETPATTTVAA